MEPLNVLVWGHANEGPCAFFRGYAYDEPLKALGVNMRHIARVDFNLKRPVKQGERVDELLASGAIELNTSDIDWADVIVFRRYYNTSTTCDRGDPMAGGCIFRTLDWDEAHAHEAETGHKPKIQDDITRLMWPVMAAQTDKAIVYETDDLHVSHGVAKWNGYWPDTKIERGMVESMARRADLITTSTPKLRSYYVPYSEADRVRVVRNAIVPEMYAADTPRPEGDRVRLGYYGSTARMRDWGGHPKFYSNTGEPYGPWYGGWAAYAARRLQSQLRTVFIGTNPDTEHVVRAFGFEEQVGYINGIAAFSRALGNAHMDIGAAPLGGDDFDACKSELHWLEYTMAGAVTIATRFMGGPDGGPYNVIRDGVDGVLVKNKTGDWYDGLKRLVDSADLRADMLGAARERVLRDYDYRVRAAEWADAFRWAAEHRGIGLQRAVA